MSEIEGYVVTIGVYVEKSYYISGTSDDMEAVEAAHDDFIEDLGDLAYEETDIEILNCEPEYHEDE